MFPQYFLTQPPVPSGLCFSFLFLDYIYLAINWMIDGEGNLYGYVESAMTGEIMRDIVEQTMEAQP